MLFGREISVLLEIIYVCLKRLRQDLFTRKKFENRWLMRTRVEKIDCISHIKNDYYDWHISGIRFAPCDLVWMWSFVAEKYVALKFYKQWTGPDTVKNKLFDITYKCNI